MDKKAIIAVLSTMTLVIIASISLVLAIGSRVSAISNEKVILLNNSYLEIENNILKGFSDEGWDYLRNLPYGSKYRIEVPSGVTRIESGFDDRLVSIVIPSSVVEMDSNVFNYPLDVFCEADEKPSDWDFGWCRCGDYGTARVLWYGNWRYDNGVPTPTISNVGTLDDMKYFDSWYQNYDINYLSEEGVQYALQFDSLNVVIPDGVTAICGDWNNSASYVSAFSYNLGGGCDEWLEFGRRVVSVSLPDGLKTIGEGAFSKCDALTNITIPNSVIRIDECAFYDCSGLTSIVIPASVESMGEYVFNCDSLAVINCECSEEYAREHWNEYFNGSDAEIVWNYVPTYTVTFNENGIDSQTINKNGNVVEPAEPTREGYEFKYWYTVDENVAFDFANTPITTDIILTAKWEAIPEPSNPEPTEPENQEQNNETTPTEQESTEMKENKNNGAVIAAIAGTSGVVGVTAIGTIVGVVLKKRRK